MAHPARELIHSNWFNLLIFGLYLLIVNTVKYKTILFFKSFFLLHFFLFNAYIVTAQDFNNCEKNSNSLIGLLKKEYSDLPFDGAKYVFLGDCKYIIGVGTTSTQSKNNSVMARISSVKARREIVLLLNGASVTSEDILTTEQIIKDDSINYFEIFRDEVTTKADAFVNGMPMLTAFKSTDGSTFVYIIYKSI